MASFSRAAKIAGTLCLVFGNGAGQAAEVTTGNLGSVLCEKYLAALSNDQDQAIVYFYWAQGFMTGLNQDLIKAEPAHSYNVLHDRAGQQAGLKAYCVEHPRAPFGDAVNTLFSTLPLIDQRPPPPK